MFRRPHPSNSACLAAFALALVAQPVAAHDPDGAHHHDHEVSASQKAANPVPLALMGTVPIYWGEVEGGFDAMITGAQHPHWARAALEEDFALWPLDYLTPEALAPFEFLLMAQPRGLTGEENVALDNWVRAGGRLLLFADPMMTGHSHYPLGDRRRPQDTILLSPILARWGLELLFDDAQAEGIQMRENVGSGDSAAIPVDLAGQFALRESQDDCSLKAAETLAFCTIGEGRAVILADAALLDLEAPPHGAREAFDALRALTFTPLRENVGERIVLAHQRIQISEKKEKNTSPAAADWQGERVPEPPPDP